MSKRNKMLFIALFLLAGLILLFRKFFFMNVIEPVALVIWTLWNLISNIDQRLCWGGVIVFCLMVALQLIPSSEFQLQKPAYIYEACPQSQFDSWKGMIESGDHERLRKELKVLLLKVLAKSNDYQSSETYEANISFTTLSVETQEYLLTKTRIKGDVFQGSTSPSLKTFLTVIIQRLIKKTTKKEIDMIHEVILWMETELEISYEE